MRAGFKHLATGALSVANTVNAYRSVKTSPALVPSWIVGGLTSELPLHLLAAEALGAGRAARRGAHASLAGRVGFGLHAASWFGLLGLHRRALRSADRLELALVEGLGVDYRERTACEEALVGHTPTLRNVALPSLGRIRPLRHARDIAYGEHGKRNHLDVWRDPDAPTPTHAPVVIHIPGGCWTSGSKDHQAHPLLSRLTKAGWVCVSLNYRLAPADRWPAQIVDVKRAIAWVRENIAEYGGDPDFVVLTGGAAGGQLAALAALTPNDPAYQPGFEDADTTVQAAVPLYGVYDLTNSDLAGHPETIRFWETTVVGSPLEEERDLFEAASPLFRVGPQAPPMFVLHGAEDSLLLAAQARLFVEQLRQVSSHPVVHAELPAAQHGFDTLPSPRAHHVAGAIHRFLSVIYHDHVGRQIDIELGEQIVLEPETTSVSV